MRFLLEKEVKYFVREMIHRTLTVKCIYAFMREIDNFLINIGHITKCAIFLFMELLLFLLQYEIKYNELAGGANIFYET